MGGISGAGNIIGNASISAYEVGDRTYTGVYSGTGGFSQEVPSVFNIVWANTYSGTTTIAAGGTVRAIAANALSPNSVVTLTLPQNTGTSTVLANGGTLDLGGYSQTIAGLIGAMFPNTLNISSSATLTINPNTGATDTFLSPLGGSGSLVIGGAGTEVLLGSNTYTGTTTVNSGTLRELLASFQSSSQHKCCNRRYSGSHQR